MPLMSFEVLAWIAVFGVCVFVAVYFAILEMTSAKSGGVRAAEEEVLSSLSPFITALKPLGVQYLHTMSSKDIHSLEKKLGDAGYRNDLSPAEFIALRFVAAIGAGLLGLVFAAAMIGMNAMALGGMAFFAIAGWSYPSMWLGSEARSRQQKIFRGLSNTLDVLSISVQAGLEMREGLERVVAIGTEPALDRELDKTLQEINKGGKSLAQGFEDLRDRVDMPEMTAFCNVLLMAFQLGAVGVGDLLAEQAEAIRTERVLRAERLTAEMPAKILFPIALFIFPAVLVTILGPLGLRAYLDFGG